MKKLVLIIMIAVLGICLMTVSCTPVSCIRAPLPMPGEASMPELPATMPAPMPPEALPEEEWVYKESGAEVLPSTGERMIVRTGDMALVVEDVINAKDEIANLVVELGGYVVSSQISGEEEERWGWISIRVPDDKFDQALAELRRLAVRVTSESASSQDITEEYIDLESRLKNAEATESQYLALLEKAEDVEDTLKIYDALSRIRYEIEQIKGRMQYLERTSAMSLISVSLESLATAKPLVRPSWSAREALKSAIRRLFIVGQGLGTAAIWSAIFSPIWGTTLGILYWRYRRKKKA